MQRILEIFPETLVSPLAEKYVPETSPQNEDSRAHSLDPNGSPDPVFVDPGGRCLVYELLPGWNLVTCGRPRPKGLSRDVADLSVVWGVTWDLGFWRLLGSWGGGLPSILPPGRGGPSPLHIVRSPFTSSWQPKLVVRPGAHFWGGGGGEQIGTPGLKGSYFVSWREAAAEWTKWFHLWVPRTQTGGPGPAPRSGRSVGLHWRRQGPAALCTVAAVATLSCWGRWHAPHGVARSARRPRRPSCAW